MILLVDVGNTRIKWTQWSGGDVSRLGDCPTPNVAGLRQVWNLSGINFALVSCVAGDAVRRSLAELLADAGISVHWVQPEYSRHRLINHYQPPGSLGADRYAALIGASRRLQRDCVVVSVGTAMTSDILTGDGQFLGGCIVPGPDLMRRSLFSGTAGIRASTGRWQDIPRDTGAAVDSGVALALLGVVEGMRRSLAEMRGRQSVEPLDAVVLTGGARSWLMPLMRCEVIEVDELVLEGLAWIARDLGFAG